MMNCRPGISLSDWTQHQAQLAIIQGALPITTKGKGNSTSERIRSWWTQGRTFPVQQSLPLFASIILGDYRLAKAVITVANAEELAALEAHASTYDENQQERILDFVLPCSHSTRANKPTGKA